MPVKRIITYVYLLIFNINYSYITLFYAIMRSYFAIYAFTHIILWNSISPFVLFHRKRSPFSKGRRQCVSGKSRHSDAARNKDIKKQVKRAVVGGDSRHARQDQHKPWSDGVFLANTAFRSRVIYRV